MISVFALCLIAAQIQSPQAIERIAELQVKSQPSAENWQRLGLARYLQNRFESAIPAFRHAVELAPSLWSSHLFLGISQYRTNAFGDAVKSLEAARKLAPATAQGSDDIDYWLGATYLALKRPWDSLKTLEVLITKNPAHKDALATLARVYADLAGTLWNDVAERSLDTPAGLEVHGHALESEGNLVDALATYKQAKAKAPQRAGPGLAIGRLLLRQGKTQEALAVLTAERMLAPSDPETYFTSGLALLQAGKAQEALPFLRSASEWTRNNADAPIALAQVLLSLGNAREAAEAAKKALALDPASAAAREILAALPQ